MDPHENHSGESSGRVLTIHLTRDTIILIAALIFLTLALLLAVIFPVNSSGIPPMAATTVAQASTPSAPSGPQAPAAIQPTATRARHPTATPAAAGLESYPAPLGPSPAASDLRETTIANLPTIASAPRATPPGLPTFAPTRLAGANVLPPGVSLALQTAYPAPAQTSTATVSATATATVPGLFEPTAATSDVGSASTATATATLDAGAPGNSVQPPVPTLGQSVPPPSAPTATARPRPTPRPRIRPTAGPTATPEPTEIPVDVLRGNMRWTAAKGPILLRRDQQLVAGASLIIEPGVEVRLAPGVSFFIEGTLYAIGEPGRPVRFIGSERSRWEGLFGRPGSNIGMDNVEIRGGGAGGTVMTSEGGNLTLRHARLVDNGGHLQINDSRMEIRDSEIAGNDMPYGAAIESSYTNGGFAILTNNRIGGNRMSGGAVPVQITARSAFDTVNLDIQGNLLVGQDGPDLVLFYNGPFPGGLDITLPGPSPFQGELACNTLMNGASGLSIRSEDIQVPRLPLRIHDNVIDDHTPPIIPIYLKYGLGRGATSEVAIDMRNNWWGDPSGPYEPDRHADGRGDSVGDMVDFDPWLTALPSCAPKP